MKNGMIDQKQFKIRLVAAVFLCLGMVLLLSFGLPVTRITASQSLVDVPMGIRMKIMITSALWHSWTAV